MSTPSPSFVEGKVRGTKPSFFDGKDCSSCRHTLSGFAGKWHRCIVFRTEIDGLNRISVEHRRVLSTLDQSSRIPILYMLYDSDIATGPGSAKVIGFEVVKGSTIEADTYLGHHRRSLGDRRRMLNSTNGNKVLAVRSAAVLS